MSIRLVISCATLILSACASSQQWYLNGKTLAEFHAESQQCAAVAAQAMDQRNANQAGYMMGSGQPSLGLAMVFMESAAYDLRLRQCMAAYGYTPGP